MNGVNGHGIIVAKDGNIHLSKKKPIQRIEDPELLAEIRYAKENGLDIPKALALETAKPVERKPRMLSQRNRSKSTSDVKVSPPPKVKSTKAERKARNRAVSGTYSKKDGNRFDYGLDDFDDVGEIDEAVADDDDSDGEYVLDTVYKYDAEKVSGAIAEYFSNGDVDCALVDLSDQLFNNDAKLRVTKELIRESLAYDESRVALGHKLLMALLKDKHTNETAIHRSFEELMCELDDLIKDMPRAPQFLALFISKVVADFVLPRLVFDDITSKLHNNRQATSCALEAYMYLKNPALLHAKFEPCGGYESLDSIRQQMEKILREFLVSQNCPEVAERLRHLHVPHYHHELVYLVGVLAIEKMNENLMAELAKLLKHLIETGFLLASSVKPGFQKLYDSMGELYIDVPAAYTLCQRWIKVCEKFDFLEESIVSAVPKPTGKRNRTLSESDQDGKFHVIDEAPLVQNGVCT